MLLIVSAKSYTFFLILLILFHKITLFAGLHILLPQAHVRKEWKYRLMTFVRQIRNEEKQN